jgi:hypothetical protein
MTSAEIRNTDKICSKVENKEHILYSETLHILKCTNMATERKVDTEFDKLKVFVICRNGDYVPLYCD